MHAPPDKTSALMLRSRPIPHTFPATCLTLESSCYCSWNGPLPPDVLQEVDARGCCKHEQEPEPDQKLSDCTGEEPEATNAVDCDC